jgi:hypothetical protein
VHPLVKSVTTMTSGRPIYIERVEERERRDEERERRNEERERDPVLGQ